jgi:hypothetical protein
VLIVKWGKDIARRERKEEADYNKLYNHIESFLEGNIDLSGQKQYIRDQIDVLIRMPYHNSEKTHVLYIKYLERFSRKEALVS